MEYRRRLAHGGAVSMMRHPDQLEPETRQDIQDRYDMGLADDWQPCCDIECKDSWWVCDYHEGYDDAMRARHTE
jgi:hypothetical protein